MTKKDFAILHVLINNECFTEMYSMTIKEFQLDMKPSTIKRKILDLVQEGYIKNGLMDGKAKTYYISEKGVKIYKEEVK